MPLTPGEADRLLLHLQALLARERRSRGLLLNVPEARALIADAVCEWARDGLSLTDARGRAQRLLGADEVLPGVVGALGEIRVEARFDDGTRLVVVKEPFAGGAATPPPPQEKAAHGWEVVEITNEASAAIGLTSHIHLAEVNPRLRLDRGRAFGTRPAIPTGETIWIGPGECARLPVRPIAGERVVIGSSGVVDGRLDDPATRERALVTLRACGYLDIVEGRPLGDAATAETAVAALMRSRATGEEGAS